MDIGNKDLAQQGLFDIYEQYHVPFWQTTLFYSICVILFFVAGSVFIYYALRYYRSKKALLTPWDQALHDLESLHKSGMMKPSTGKHFYGGLTSVLKQYVHQRYFSAHQGLMIDGLAYTDEEFLNTLKEKDFDPVLYEDLQEICMGSLVVKFANAQAIQEQMEKDLLLAKSFIKRTQPITTKK